MNFKAIIESHVTELFVSKPGVETWEASKFAMSQTSRLQGRLEASGFKDVKVMLSIWPEDDKSTEHINEAKQSRITVKADGYETYETTFDFKGQVDFVGKYFSYTAK